jgi:hypothetical protein
MIKFYANKTICSLEYKKLTMQELIIMVLKHKKFMEFIYLLFFENETGDRGPRVRVAWWR